MLARIPCARFARNTVTVNAQREDRKMKNKRAADPVSGRPPFIFLFWYYMAVKSVFYSFDAIRDSYQCWKYHEVAPCQTACCCIKYPQ